MIGENCGNWTKTCLLGNVFHFILFRVQRLQLPVPWRPFCFFLSWAKHILRMSFSTIFGFSSDNYRTRGASSCFECFPDEIILGVVIKLFPKCQLENWVTRATPTRWRYVKVGKIFSTFLTGLFVRGRGNFSFRFYDVFARFFACFFRMRRISRRHFLRSLKRARHCFFASKVNRFSE